MVTVGAFHEVEYQPTRTLYALDPSTYEARETIFPATVLHQASVAALWTVTRKGVTKVSSGLVSTSYYDLPAAPDFVYFLEHFYGRSGHPEVTWDGEYLWAPKATLAAMNAHASLLEPTRLALPLVPQGFIGWYELKMN